MSESTFHLVSRDVRPGEDGERRMALLCAQSTPELRDLRKSATRYQLSVELETAINMALTVAAPLLLTGEPGTGKTQVAYFLAEYFATEVAPFHVKSTSTATDLKYEFDAVAYLRYAQRGDSVERKRDDPLFLHKRALWQAYESEKPLVVLIDEIDKAPRDFPNDLLHELDQHGFRHPFDDKIEIRPVHERPPIVVITSNAERRLPDAFLRRCIHHHIDLTPELVQGIVGARTQQVFPSLERAAVESAVQRFFELRALDGLSKKPSTAELLTWLAILSARGVKAEALSQLNRGLPAIAALIKDQRDLQKLG